MQFQFITQQITSTSMLQSYQRPIATIDSSR